jgi:hypothetical protein
VVHHHIRYNIGAAPIFRRVSTDPVEFIYLLAFISLWCFFAAAIVTSLAGAARRPITANPSPAQ